MNSNLHDLSDDELDHLFSDAAEKMEIDFEPDSWTKMSQKLDATSGKTQEKNTGLKRGLLLLLALLFVVGGYYLMKPSTDKVNEIQTNDKNNSEKESKEIDKKDVSTSKVDTDNLAKNKKENSEQKNVSEKDISDSESVTYENNKTGNKGKVINSVNGKNEVLPQKNEDISSKSNKSIIAKNENLGNPLTKNTVVENTKSSKTNKFSKDKTKEISENTTSSEANVVTNKNIIFKKNNKENSDLSSPQSIGNSEAVKQYPSNNLPENSTSINSTISSSEENEGRLALKTLNNLSPKNAVFKANFKLPILAFDSPKVEPPSMPISKNFKRGFYFRAAFSPDFSVVDKEELTKVGKNIALLLEYRFNKRWSVQSGLIRSSKYYNAYPESYVWPTKWAQPPAILNINAICQMTDLPINIRYDISQKTNSSWFVSSGVTSYFMINEKYVYNYVNPTSPYIKNRGWNGKTGPFRFGVLNVSGGYEQQLFKRLSIQVEPFAKIPLTKIGFGKVSLSTFGVFFSAKYPLVRF